MLAKNLSEVPILVLGLIFNEITRGPLLTCSIARPSLFPLSILISTLF